MWVSVYVCICKCEHIGVCVYTHGYSMCGIWIAPCAYKGSLSEFVARTLVARCPCTGLRAFLLGDHVVRDQVLGSGGARA